MMPPSVMALGKVLTPAAPLAVLGAGSVLGENLLGYDPEQVRSCQNAAAIQWTGGFLRLSGARGDGTVNWHQVQFI
jgi:hypothetical protein